jgi:FkbM family methyltransferase
LIRIHKHGFSIRFYPSALSAEYWTNGNSRQEEENLVRKCLNLGDTYIDIGANIGVLTLAAACQVGERGQIYAIEAHPRIFRYLLENVRLNGFRQVITLNVAVGDHNNDVVFFCDRRQDDRNAVISDGSMCVPLARLDDLLRSQVKRIHLLKIDVEGYEKQVLIGAQEHLQVTDAVFFESSQKQYNSFGYGCAEVFDILERARFTLYKPDVRSCTLSKLQRGYVSEFTENLLAIRDVDSFVKRTGFVCV